jgi:hypothetical protein
MSKRTKHGKSAVLCSHFRELSDQQVVDMVGTLGRWFYDQGIYADDAVPICLGLIRDMLRANLAIDPDPIGQQFYDDLSRAVDNAAMAQAQAAHAKQATA